MRLREAVKLQDGDRIRCGPNDCGCDGSVYVVERSKHPCGCVRVGHEGNERAFVIIPGDGCNISYHLVGARYTYSWPKGNNGYQRGSHWNAEDDDVARILARNLRRAV